MYVVSDIINEKVIELLRGQYLPSWNGIHGFDHWSRVRINGLQLAKLNGANTHIVELFSFFHDIKRLNDGPDPDHGFRASRFVEEINSSQLGLSSDDLDLLVVACRDHTKGLIDGHITIQTCWDADRLDLGRVGIRPDPRRLCTIEAKSHALISEAVERSIQVRGN